MRTITLGPKQARKHAPAVNGYFFIPSYGTLSAVSSSTAAALRAPGC